MPCPFAPLPLSRATPQPLNPAYSSFPSSSPAVPAGSPSATTNTRPARESRSRVIDAWRALACSIVVVFHGICGCHALAVHPILRPILDHGKIGWVGRNLLFMISGYCLARSLERRAHDPRPLEFWRDRLLRIYLLYWAALAVSMLMALAATPFNGLSAGSALPASPLAWLGDLSLTHIWMGIETKLTVSWSLSFEIGFYLVVGAALLKPFHGSRARLAMVMAITALSLSRSVTSYVPLLGLWPVFACGLAVYAALNPRLPAGLRVLALAYPPALAFLHVPEGRNQIYVPALLSLAFLATIALGRFMPAVPRFVSLLGTASYSVFLLHIPVMSPVLNLAKRLLPTTGVAFLLVWVLHILLGFAGGLLFYRWVERPLEAWRRRVFNSPAANPPAPAP